MAQQPKLQVVNGGDDELMFRAHVQAAVQGDPDAATWLYRKYVGMVYSYFRACAVADADDLTSEVFVSMLRSLNRFQGDERAFRTWLMTIAHRRKVDHFRRTRAGRTITADPTTIEAQLEKAPSAADAARLADNRLPAALGQLTADQREILAMRFLADMSLADIASATNRRVGAIKSMQRRAIESLRRTVPDLRAPEAVR